MNELLTLTAAELQRQGWTIDRRCYPWLAYKGPRFSPTESFPCRTPRFIPKVSAV